MRKIVYYVAVSLDGFIAGPGNDISEFILQGEGVEKYQNDLLNFDTVIMGRKTYEFGYQYGLTPGQPAYPHMEHYIFSDTLAFPTPHEKVQAIKLDIEKIIALKNGEGKDIYLCGGGEFAGWLLDHGQIDLLKLKLNPVILGEGIRLFGSSSTKVNTSLMDVERFNDGLQIITYELIKD
ncbi:dihydrofolate reductase [Fulvivirga sp. M361]|uniref:dihydrofolate reductase family protein n=1 Tax=Fulvivirga sp. M361 TaxID=2594266 RepID=UPI00117B946D|nr:dihydrofolate reductase family protein [Fulvivirga sp. M361]TRX59949.1 dihydrofolate reductase [Fulvivirga sp. M361]